MQDPQILSTPHTAFDSDPPLAPTVGAAQHALVFDACHVGVVLRAVLFVQSLVATAALFNANTTLDWLARMALMTSASLPGTLLWLVTACCFKRLLQRFSVQAQYAAAMALGALSGLYAGAMLWLVDATAATPWLACAISGALLSTLLITGLLLRARARAPAATAARLAELQSRIRPHFLFNTLNSAIALVRAEPAKAEALLEDLSELFRYALAEPHDSVTLDEEICLAQRYLAIEQLRFGARLQLHWQLAPEAGCAQLPPLLLQPLVENAIRHGIEPSAQGGTVEISTALRNGRVEITIVNSLPPKNPGSTVLTSTTATHKTGAPQPRGSEPFGKLRTPPSTSAAVPLYPKFRGRRVSGSGGVSSKSTRGHGIALLNVRERLALLHDLQAEFSAGSREGRYCVRIILPLEKTP